MLNTPKTHPKTFPNHTVTTLPFMISILQTLLTFKRYWRSFTGTLNVIFLRNENKLSTNSRERVDDRIFLFLALILVISFLSKGSSNRILKVFYVRKRRWYHYFWKPIPATIHNISNQRFDNIKYFSMVSV